MLSCTVLKGPSRLAGRYYLGFAWFGTRMCCGGKRWSDACFLQDFRGRIFYVCAVGVETTSHADESLQRDMSA